MVTAPVSATTAAADPVIAAAGDIACDPATPAFNGGLGTKTQCRQLAVSELLIHAGLTAVLPLGDEQYEQGRLTAFNRSYDASWGRVLSITRPTPGNHEYGTAGAAGYYGYFGSRAGGRGKGYYSYDVGRRHLIALNAQCRYVSCAGGSAQERWLAADLAAHPRTCTLAFWHQPRFSSGKHGSDRTYDAFWRDLYAAGADVVLNGHDHDYDYERFAPQNAGREDRCVARPARVRRRDRGPEPLPHARGDGQQPGPQQRQLRRTEDDVAPDGLRLGIRVGGRRVVPGRRQWTLPQHRPLIARLPVGLVAVVTAVSTACSGQSHPGGTAMSRHRGPAARAPGTIVSPAPVPSSTGTGSRGTALPVRRRVIFGRSVLGVPLVVDVHGAAASAHRLLVVGCIHGDEGAGITIARALEAQPAPAGVQVWVVDDLNPDGFRLHTRQNADHVDLNRNFPYAWAPLGRPGDQQYPGPQPLSEPEARAAAGLIEMVRPEVTIWFHQPLNVVDDSGGAQNVERRFAALAGMRFRRLTRYPGSAASWQNHAQRGSTAFVVELPRPTPAATAGRLATAVDELLGSPAVPVAPPLPR